ncbi:Hypothetical predicted protein [Lynx pardinus]|uniref:Uncharacterized protein n=1 Tax=Lynx pardinus TaxID=191816 RepID=A0A485MMI7_LYNPA|nr:Hypothetical predicted protein [Lynx pardinus]
MAEGRQREISPRAATRRARSDSSAARQVSVRSGRPSEKESTTSSRRAGEAAVSDSTTQAEVRAALACAGVVVQLRHPATCPLVRI